MNKEQVINRLLKLETDIKKEQDKIKRKYNQYDSTDKELEKAKGMEHSYAVCQAMVTHARHDIMRYKKNGKEIKIMSKM